MAFRQIQISRNSLEENPLVADMKWFISLVVAIAVVSLAYAGTAFVSLGSLATAAREGDGARLMAMSDVPRMRHALVEQIINAYLERIGQKRELKPFERMAVQTFGASIADEVAIKLTTPDNLSALLKSGAVRDAANAKMMNDPATKEMTKNMPFDGQRMIFAGFETLLDQGAARAASRAMSTPR